MIEEADFNTNIILNYDSKKISNGIHLNLWRRLKTKLH